MGVACGSVQLQDRSQAFVKAVLGRKSPGRIWRNFSNCRLRLSTEFFFEASASLANKERQSRGWDSSWQNIDS